MSETKKTRQHESTIQIPALPEQVWQALTTAGEVQKWYAPEARIDLRPGGEYFVSWGPGMEGPGIIEEIDPARHLRTVSVRKAPGGCDPGRTGDAAPEPVRVAVDYYLEGRPSGTLLRLVHSGFLTTGDWDREFEGTRKGWPVMLRILQYSLTRHAGVPGRQAWLCALTSLNMQEAWDRFASETTSATEVYSDPPDELCRATMDTLISAVFAPYGGKTAVSLTAVAWGPKAERFESFKDHWQGVLSYLYPAVVKV